MWSPCHSFESPTKQGSLSSTSRQSDGTRSESSLFTMVSGRRLETTSKHPTSRRRIQPYNEGGLARKSSQFTHSVGQQSNGSSCVIDGCRDILLQMETSMETSPQHAVSLLVYVLLLGVIIQCSTSNSTGHSATTSVVAPTCCTYRMLLSVRDSNSTLARSGIGKSSMIKLYWKYTLICEQPEFVEIPIGNFQTVRLPRNEVLG